MGKASGIYGPHTLFSQRQAVRPGSLSSSTCLVDGLAGSRAWQRQAGREGLTYFLGSASLELGSSISSSGLGFTLALLETLFLFFFLSFFLPSMLG